MPTPTPNDDSAAAASDDLSSDYQQYRELLAQSNATEELLRGAARELDDGTDELASGGVQGLVRGSTVAEDEGSLAGRAAKDFGRGLIETPRAAYSGAHDAIAESYNLAHDVGTWVDEKLLPSAMRGGVKVTPKSIWPPHLELVTPEQMAVARVTEEDASSQWRRFFNDTTDIDDPKSSTGKALKGVAQFLTGFIGAKKFIPLRPTSGAGKAGAAAAHGAAADFAVFDPHDERLSNLIESFPALGNPVSEYLAADPTDSNAEGRFKNALEGFGLGTMTEGFVRAVRLVRQVRRARVEQEAAAAPQPPKLEEGAFASLGDEAAQPGSSLVTVERSTKLKEARELTAGTDPKAITDATGAAERPAPKLAINFARIDAPEDVTRAMQEMANRFKSSIDAERRGKQSFQTIELNAQQEDAWKALSERRRGDPLNAEQSLAARQLWVSSSQKLTELAEAASRAPSEANLFAFRKMLATHQVIQQEVVAARTETARALASWRIPAGGSAERLRQVQDALEANGGPQLAKEMADRIASLARNGKFGEIEKVVTKGAYAKTRDAFIEAWVNGLLSSPATHMVNAMSNTSVIFQQMAERAVAAKIAQSLGHEGSVAAGEATAQWFGLVSGLRDALRYAGKTAMTGESGFGLNKLEAPRQRAISSEALGISSGGWLGRSVDLLGAGVNAPGRAMGVADEFFKTAGYRMELNAQALRQATSEVAAGKIGKDGLKARIAELIENPPENIRMAAVDAATYQTFTETPGAIAQSLGKLTSKYPTLKLILPFTRTPANILRYTFERTPLAPLQSQFRADIMAGGARRDIALARLGLGTSLMMVAADMAMNGQVSGRGPANASERAARERQGWKPYSIKVGERWYAYNRLDPMGSTFGMAADLVDSLRNGQAELVDDADAERVTVATALAIAGNLTNKTYLSGLSDFFEAMANPEMAGEANIRRLVGSAVPAGVAVIARAQDPYVHEVNSMMDALRARLPGVSDSLPVRRNLWGEPISHESGLGTAYDIFSPIYTKPNTESPIDQEILRLGANVTMPPRRTSFDGVSVDLSQYPGAYSRYLELSGNGLKHPAWNLGAKDLLNQVIEGKHPLSQVYKIRSDGPEGGKDVFIRDILQQYRELARRKLLEEFPEIRGEVDSKKENQRALRMPRVG